LDFAYYNSRTYCRHERNPEAEAKLLNEVRWNCNTQNPNRITALRTQTNELLISYNNDKFSNDKAKELKKEIRQNKENLEKLGKLCMDYRCRGCEGTRRCVKRGKHQGMKCPPCEGSGRVNSPSFCRIKNQEHENEINLHYFSQVQDLDIMLTQITEGQLMVYSLGNFVFDLAIIQLFRLAIDTC
jgi:hypothetical protein